jgi:phage repressor protein C with HTH and peptisase S24 domain
MGTVAGTRRAELSILEFCLPGEAAQAAGVILYDPESGEWRAKMRRDWKAVAGEEAEVLQALAEDFSDKLSELGADAWLRQCEQMLGNVLRISDREAVVVEDLDRAVERMFRKHVRTTVQPFVTHLPKFSARVAAGRFLEDNEVEAEEWLEAPEDLRLDPDMFVVEITGRSMEPRIPDGSLAVFRAGVQGSRQGKLLLIERRDVSESGGRYTVKRYRSVKESAGEDEWRHRKIRLEALNPEYESWELEEDPDRFRVIGELVRVLPPVD